MYNGTRWVNGNSAGTGTVTSIGITSPNAALAVSGLITSAGQLKVDFAAQLPNLFFMSPATGSTAGAPLFRAIVAADLAGVTIDEGVVT